MVTHIDWIAIRALHCPHDSIHNIVDVAKASGLGSVAVDGQVLAGKRLVNEIWHHPAIVLTHTWSIGVEDANDAGFERMKTVVGHGQGLGEALGFIVGSAR